MLELAVTPDPRRGLAPRPLRDPSPRVACGIDAELEHRLRTEPIIWISSTRPDRLPHLVPLWFSWDGDAIWIFSKADAQKIRNVRHGSSVMLAVGSAHPEFDVELLEGKAEVLDVSTAAVMPAIHVEKYRDAMSRAGLTPELYAQRYTQPVRITPSRVLDWHARELSSRGSR